MRELIYKRGHGRMRKQRIALTDNDLVEKALGTNIILLNVCIQHQHADQMPAPDVKIIAVHFSCTAGLRQSYLWLMMQAFFPVLSAMVKKT